MAAPRHPDQEMRILPYLREDEKVLLTGMAQSVEIAERLGRGQGEGWLFLATNSLWHWVDGVNEPRCITREINGVSTMRVVYPGIRQLTIRAPEGTFNFYCGKKFCKDVAKLANG